MRNEIKLMQRLFEKYRLTNPLPDDVQEHAYRMKRKTLVSMLKNLGLYSPVYGAILIVYLALKEIGIGLGVAQSAAVLFVASAITALGIAAGGYVAVKKVAPTAPPRAEQEAPVKEAAPAVGGAARPEVTAGADRASYRYVIQFYGLDNNGADEAMVRRVAGALTGEILRLKGKDTTALVSAPSESGWFLTGSVEKLDRSYLLTVRLTDRRTRRIIFAASKESADEEGLVRAGSGFARSISEEIQ
jgi:hypothetical protein